MRVTPFRPQSAALPLLGEYKPRIAQLTSRDGFHGANLFPPSKWRDLTAFAPNVLVGSSSDLQRLVERIDLGTLTLESVDHSIYVMTELGDAPLADVLRVVLWQRFGVPVYELMTDGTGTLLAYECENHDGLHISAAARFAVLKGELVYAAADGQAIRTGLKRYLESACCPCGRAGVRIIEHHPEQPADSAFEKTRLAAIA